MDGIKNKQEFRKWCALCQDGRQSDYTVFSWSVFNGEEIILKKNNTRASKFYRVWTGMLVVT